ncbi:hypothetical protein CDD82_4096 [Ophiocordyceps australis]|uniref:Uncharacterized protein n=1 Tax=Ophiocordyceps australis TaxID=1399860 RepID=A0A2C5ZT03_9HYPO|nr:hypothetical protein CDD82_4096 [Ophiocordyceps australis]
MCVKGRAADKARCTPRRFDRSQASISCCLDVFLLRPAEGALLRVHACGAPPIKTRLNATFGPLPLPLKCLHSTARTVPPPQCLHHSTSILYWAALRSEYPRGHGPNSLVLLSSLDHFSTLAFRPPSRLMPRHSHAKWTRPLPSLDACMLTSRHLLLASCQPRRLARVGAHDPARASSCLPVTVAPATSFSSLPYQDSCSADSTGTASGQAAAASLSTTGPSATAQPSHTVHSMLDAPRSIIHAHRQAKWIVASELPQILPCGEAAKP